MALSLYKLDNGGIDLFASHSLEGTAASSSRTMSTSYGGDTNDNSSIEGGGGGGASNVKIEALVRRIADMAQSSTQNLGGKYGRMLSSSLLAMGVQDQPPSPPPQQQQQQQTNHETNHETEQNDNDDKLCLWRVDPTGQFWKCDASAVGRGTVEVEEELLNRVRQWKKKNNNKKKNEHDDTSSSVAVVQSTITSSLTDNDNNGDDELNQVRITNNDVRSYLSSLTEDEAVKIASDCLVNGIMNCKGTPTHNEKRTGGGGNGSALSSSLRDWMEYDLRRRMHCVILRSTSCGSSKQSSSYEIVRRL